MKHIGFAFIFLQPQVYSLALVFIGAVIHSYGWFSFRGYHLPQRLGLGFSLALVGALIFVMGLFLWGLNSQSNAPNSHIIARMLRYWILGGRNPRPEDGSCFYCASVPVDRWGICESCRERGKRHDWN